MHESSSNEFVLGQTLVWLSICSLADLEILSASFKGEKGRVTDTDFLEDKMQTLEFSSCLDVSRGL